MYILGLIISLLIGVVLGLVGGGGSILTVPLVHYFFGESMLLATSYSLFIVAVAAGIGALQRMRHGDVDFRKGFIFVLPSMLTAFSIRMWIMPLFPIQFSVSDWSLSRDLLITVLLIVVMVYTAYRTLVSRRMPSTEPTSVSTIVLYGVLTGMLSGFIGAGGGFIIVPILLRMGLSMKKAVGTSMLIIAIQSLVAMGGDFFNDEISHGGVFNWTLLLSLTLLTVSGVFAGTALQRKIPGRSLRKIFSLLLLFVAIGLITKLIVN